MNNRLIKLITPILLFLLALIDGQMTSLFENLFKDQIFPISGMFLIALLISTQRLNSRFLVLTALVIGYLMDTYYSGILGINMLVLPVSIFFVEKAKNVINQNLFTQLFGTIILVTFYQVSITVIQGIFKLVTVNPVNFIAKLLGPTLILNIVLFFIIAPAFRKLFQPR